MRPLEVFGFFDGSGFGGGAVLAALWSPDLAFRPKFELSAFPDFFASWVGALVAAADDGAAAADGDDVEEADFFTLGVAVRALAAADTLPSASGLEGATFSACRSMVTGFDLLEARRWLRGDWALFDVVDLVDFFINEFSGYARKRGGQRGVSGEVGSALMSC